MMIRCYLIVTENGVVAVRKNEPRPQIGECVVPLRLQIPDTVFRPRFPQVIVIDVPEQHIAQPMVETFAPEGVESE